MEVFRRIRYIPKPLGALFFANFFLFFHLFLILYFNSSYLGAVGVETETVGSIYSLGAFFALASFFFFPTLLKKFHAKGTLLLLTTAEGLAIIMLATSIDPLLSIAAFILYLVSYPLLVLTLDVLLEGNLRDERHTGGVRGGFLTFQNAALVSAPFVGGLLLADVRFSLLYLFSALLLIPFYATARSCARRFVDPLYHNMKIVQSFGLLRSNVNLRGAFLSHFLLRLFFSFMVIYTPLYLLNEVGFTTGEVGLLLALVLIPFVLLELPLGFLADRRYGEKEFLIIGLLIIAASTAALSFIESTAFLLWVGALFVTRIGASFVEIATESYFFKQVDGDDADLMSLFRMLRPLGYLVGPLLGSAFLAVLDFKYIFLALGVIIFFGIAVASPIEDTR